MWIGVVAYKQFPHTVVIVLLLFESKLDDADKGWGEESLLECKAGVAGGLTLHVGEGEGVGVAKSVAVMGINGRLGCASLGPLYAPTPGVHVLALGPVGNGSVKAAWISMGGSFLSKDKLEAHSKRFTSVRYGLPAASFLDNFPMMGASIVPADYVVKRGSTSRNRPRNFAISAR